MNHKEYLFLTQSYNDAWKNYCEVLNNSNLIRWDWVFITASNDKQAESYKTQIDMRLKNGFLPLKTKYEVITDIENMRIGSGGATLNVLKYISENTNEPVDFQKLRILVIHSGGDSKRIPQYSHKGKLFAPIPRIYPNGRRATLFDEMIIATAGIANRTTGGLLVIPGDTEIVFNAFQIDLNYQDAAALSIKTDVEEGKEHGVFIADDKNLITSFLHKNSVSVLKEKGAVDLENNVDIDTGFIWLSHKIVSSLFSLISSNGVIDYSLFNMFVNDKVRLSFYADFVYPLAKDSTLQEYLKEIPEADFSNELSACRRQIWDKISKYNMNLISVMPSKYLHIGTTPEFFNLMTKDIDKYDFLGWQKKICSIVDENTNCAANNSIVECGAVLNGNCYIENSIIDKNCVIGNNVILSDVILSGISVPDYAVIQTISLKNKKYVTRIYGIDDNPKSSPDGRYLCSTLRAFFENFAPNAAAFYDERIQSLWNAKLFPVCDSKEQSVEAALDIFAVSAGKATEEQKLRWLNSDRISLAESYNNADVESILLQELEIENKIAVKKCIDVFDRKGDLDTASNMLSQDLMQKQKQAVMLFDLAEKMSLSVKTRIYLLLSELCREGKITIENHNPDSLEDKCYNSICQGIVNESLKTYDSDFLLKKGFYQEYSEVKLPVRVNFCGSPSDAAPYCLDFGGTMINAAILLKNERPITVRVDKINEKCIRFESKDLNTTTVYKNIQEIRNCSSPVDCFGIHKAALLACGIIPLNGNVNLEEYLDRLGGGISIFTSVDVPKGSGLGTSSIIAAACVKAISNIFDLEYSDETIYDKVFCIEQLMTTGGGWQDQVGGLTNGIKFITSKPGTNQKLNISYVDMEESSKKELSDRFILIFSGQRRLARNVLRKEMNKCLASSEENLWIMDKIKQLTVMMKYYLEQGQIDNFAARLTEQFELVKKLDNECTNTCIDFIFAVCDDLIAGKSICGAGGGGFLQAVLKQGVSKAQVDERLKKYFKNCGVKLWDSTLLF